ncbi:MAG TPA: mechanosensitive ion channel domain-containing protein [Candidatus Elarobacter sp.]|jgi:small-conductance mechanosensitive channel
MNQRVWLNATQVDAIVTIVWVFFAIVIGVVVHRVLYWAFGVWAKRRNDVFAAAVVRRTSRPAAYIFPLIAILIVFPNLSIPERWESALLHVSGLLTIAAFAWAIVATIRLWSDVIVARHRVDVEDNLLARQLGTRVDILARVAITLVVIISIGMMLMTFSEIRALGTTVLASAGVAGIVAGLAARPLFENLVAGIQLALTQPIRLDDVVIVEKQYGRIEEIHSTYVVVRVWDLRRLIVPLSYFITTPFENWTRQTANLMGEVYVFTDFRLDVVKLRDEVPKIVERSPLWDKAFTNLQVTDATEHAMQIRVLVTARNSADLFDLRCFVREELIAYICREQPDALPRTRAELPEAAEEPRHESRAATEERIAKSVAAAADQPPISTKQ